MKRCVPSHNVPVTNTRAIGFILPHVGETDPENPADPDESSRGNHPPQFGLKPVFRLCR